MEQYCPLDEGASALVALYERADPVIVSRLVLSSKLPGPVVESFQARQPADGD